MKGRGHLATKMNVTFFMGNEVLNALSSKNFFDESNIFRENAKKILVAHDHFLGDGRWGHLTPNEYNLFYHCLGTRYFIIKQVFFFF